MSIKTAIEGTIIEKVIQKLSDSGLRTTIIGAILAAEIGRHVDWTKVMNQDPDAIASAISAALVAIFGYYAKS